MSRFGEISGIVASKSFLAINLIHRLALPAPSVLHSSLFRSTWLSHPLFLHQMSIGIVLINAFSTPPRAQSTPPFKRSILN
mmetsp:Transcript_2128/g.5917  ORF Transcript_2128/g.5917 Transcript_2128/m.5917 type:complete len:81 (-) Transcript_2128:535-777(-)